MGVMGQTIGSTDGLAWLFPLSRTSRAIADSRVPDSVFDAGRGGIAGWYSDMRANYGIGVRKGIYSICALFMLQVVAQAVSYCHFQYTIFDIVAFLAKIIIPAWLLWSSFWYFRVRRSLRHGVEGSGRARHAMAC